jgi:hypothetical protein
MDFQTYQDFEKNRPQSDKDKEPEWFCFLV